MSGVSVGQRAVELPWLCPSDEALLALASDPPGAAGALSDIAAAVHLLRFVRPTPDLRRYHAEEVLAQPSLCDSAAAFLERPEPLVRFAVEAPEFLPILRLSTAASEIARGLAYETDAGHPDLVAAVARLTVLGWVAVAAVEPEAAIRVLQSSHDPSAIQNRDWGHDSAAITRRLSTRWRLPQWLTSTIGYLKLTPSDAVNLGADEELFRVVQASVALAEEHFGYLGLTDPRTRNAHSELDCSARAILESWTESNRDFSAAPPGPEAPRWLLAKLLRTAATARRASGAVWLNAAEASIDRLTENLGDLRAEFDADLRDAKLASVAEFAAGASHEINNPLAVISGHAQLLLAGEDDPDRQKRLAVIVRQTKRVHELLQGTLQFARPSKPKSGLVHAGEWLDDAVRPFRPDAEARNVTLELASPDVLADCYLRADSTQLKAALGHLIRNGIEAAPSGGWVRLTPEFDDVPRILIEDNGPGPLPGEIPHLFDPFFSGRSAGRGRGLGLSIAWRFARLNGGDVRFLPTADRASRFVLQLPPAELPRRFAA